MTGDGMQRTRFYPIFLLKKEFPFYCKIKILQKNCAQFLQYGEKYVKIEREILLRGNKI